MSNINKKLFSKGYAYLGMLREVEMRAALLKEKVLKQSAEGDLDNETIESIEREASQIEKDLYTYSRKLNRVSEEIERHVNTKEME